MKTIAFLILFSTLHFVEAMSPQHKVEARFSQVVGVKTFEYKDENRGRPIVIELWYPLDLTSDGLDPIRNAPSAICEARFPVIMMSHGHGGDRFNQSWLAVQLAQKGYFVAAVEHFGNTPANFQPLQTLKFWDRAKDISFALDQVLEEFKGIVDEKRVGFIGYSMGGMTGLGLAGAQAKNVREVAMKQARGYKGFTEEAFNQVDFSEGEKLHGDSRIKAMLLLFPANFIYPPESLKKIKIPVGLIATVHDEILPHGEHADPIIRYLVPRMTKVIRKNISHSFLNAKSWKLESNDRVYEEISSFSFKFFNSNL